MNHSKNHFSKSLLFDAYFLLFGSKNKHPDVIQTFQHDDLKTAYRDAVKFTHPDINRNISNELATTRFREVTAAYNLLNEFLIARKTARFSAHQYGQTVTPRQASTQWPPRHAGKKAKETYQKPELKPKNNNHRYYEGLMPPIFLKTGLYFYYSGKISYEDLVASLVWQRDMRPPIGELAVKWNWLHRYFVSVILSNVEIPGQFGERAVKLGLLKESQVKVLLRHQALMQKPLGHYFVSNNILTPKDIKEGLIIMDMHNRVIARDRDERQTQAIAGSSKKMP